MTTAAATAFFVALVLVALLIQDLPWFRAPIRSALGEVRGHKAQGGETGDTYRMIIEFADETGHDHIFIDGMHHNMPWLPKDAIVEVFYPAGRPDLARSQTPTQRRRLYLSLVLLPSLWAQLQPALRPPG
ncbi:MAG: hypothetical protein AB7F41_03475 [Methylocystis sp.]|uniref:hypothetical protein n=1 Tax=Methylocystis sp. TaxID=1911079 RepID=UPI003D0ACCB6